jgi:hypothetical protein
MEHTGSSVMEQDFRPEVMSDVELLEGLDFSQAGPLKGWVKFIPKSQAEVILRVTEEDPLLVRWQHGLGRSAVFTSDAHERWAANWVEWQGFDRFWTNVVRDLLPRTPATAISTVFDQAAQELIVRYEMGDRLSAPAPAELPDLFVHGPDGYQEAVELQRAEAKTFEARIPLEGRFGLFRIRPEQDSARFPEMAYYRENAELTRYGVNDPVLRRIAEATGGKFNPEPAAVFDGGGQVQASSLNLWPGLLALAILFNLLEVLARKGWLPWLGRWA